MIIVPRSQSRLQVVRVLGALVVLALVVALDIPLGSSLSSFAQEIGSTGQYVQSRVPLVARMWSIVTERTSLAQREQELASEQARARALEVQVAELQRQVDFQRASALINGAPMRIEGSLAWLSPSQNTRVAFLDRGSADGVMVGDTVMRPPQLFVGIVSEVTEHQSRIRMAGDTLTQIPVQLSGTNASGLLRTDTEFGLVVDYVERGEAIAEGARVVTSGDDRTAPALVVGSVVGTIQDPAKLFQVIRVSVDPEAQRSGRVLIVRQP